MTDSIDINKGEGLAVFYKDKIVLLDENDDIFLIRGKKNDMYVDHYQRDKETSHKIIHEDYNQDFDAAYDYLGNKVIVYKNTENQLLLTSLKNEEEDSIIVGELENNIYYLNIIVNDLINIFYVEESSRRNMLNVVHIVIEGDKVIRNVIDSTENDEIIKPIQIREFEGKLFVFYYFRNIICLKMFNQKNREWEKSITLTDNRDKLYLDMKIISDEIHLVYSINKDNQFFINYEVFSMGEDYLIKNREIKISGIGNHTDPLLIRQKGMLYIVWKDTNKLYSCASDDDGHTWGKLREFPKVKRLDVVKYKYLNKSNLQIVDIDYTYGSTDPIKFIGF